jgi:Sulfotransferase family
MSTPIANAEQHVGQLKKLLKKSSANFFGQDLDMALEQCTAILAVRPQHFLYLGLVRLCLPAVRIIHCRRNAIDNCLSIYFQKFVDQHAYAYDLDELAGYYRQYQRLMAHWHTLFSDSILEVHYEELIADQETTTRNMLAFCDLPWDARCLDFQHNELPVFTASNWQVRQPLYSSSVERRKYYRKHLGPLAQLA